jgi:hypothetical protein
MGAGITPKNKSERIHARPFSAKSLFGLVMVSVRVPPCPVFFLFLWRQLAKIPVFVAVIFARPGLVVDDFIVVPDVIVAVVRVIDPVIVMPASCASDRSRHRGGQ